ncbi:MAG: FecR domain-containing protein [Candidatus Solibacter usitatus]|nr:FecR domain-containing protein [Candidatus Solibacter usitatus]
MRLAHSMLIAVAAAVILAPGAPAQNAISAKAGMVNVADGDVYLIDAKGGEPKKVEPKLTEFTDIKEGQILKTGEGRAEVLLTPGAFLRMAEESSFKLLSNRLTDARLDVLSGSVLIDAAELLDDNHITVLVKDATFTLTKAGLYRVDAEPARVRVFLGEAVADHDGQKVTLKGGKELVASAGGWTPGKFDVKETDALYRWAKRRSGYIAMANVSAARQSNVQSSGLRSGMWAYNPYFGFATYIPWMGTCRNPFGYYYYTPSTVIAVYYPPQPAFGGGRASFGSGGSFAGSGMSDRSAGGSSYSPSAGISASAPASSGSAGAGSSGSRGGGDAGGGATAGGSHGASSGGRGN